MQQKPLIKNMTTMNEAQIKAKNLHGLEEGMRVVLKPGELESFQVAVGNKLRGRNGTIRRIYSRLGSDNVRVAVLWHKKGTRGKEFEDTFYAHYLRPASPDDVNE
jgi:hypothetical protein